MVLCRHGEHRKERMQRSRKTKKRREEMAPEGDDGERGETRHQRMACADRELLRMPVEVEHMKRKARESAGTARAVSAGVLRIDGSTPGALPATATTRRVRVSRRERSADETRGQARREARPACRVSAPKDAEALSGRACRASAKPCEGEEIPRRIVVHRALVEDDRGRMAREHEGGGLRQSKGSARSAAREG